MLIDQGWPIPPESNTAGTTRPLEMGRKDGLCPEGEKMEEKTALGRRFTAGKIVAELPKTSHWLDASSTKGDTWDRGKQFLS